jgi:hypothetical protein
MTIALFPNYTFLITDKLNLLMLEMSEYYNSSILNCRRVWEFIHYYNYCTT